MPDCPSDNELTAFLGGRLSPEERRRIDHHIAGCPECQAVRAGVAHEPTGLGPAGLPSLPASGPGTEEPLLRSGQHLDAYRIVGLLGKGGMGEVYEAVHERIGRPAAIKVLRRRHAYDRGLVQRFLGEALAPNRVVHPGLVQIYGIGQLPDGSDYLVMEYLDGVPLGTRVALARNDPELVLRLGAQVADALAAAHEAGVVHRDLKPDNVMVVPDRQVPGGERAKVLDFGLAKLPAGPAGPSPALETPSRAVFGTPAYMAPEQCRGAAHVDGKADVYTLGVVLFQLLAGRLLFIGDGAEVMAMHLRDEPPSLHELVPALAREVAQLVAEMLRKDPAARPEMAAVAERLLRLAETAVMAAAAERGRDARRRRLLRLGRGALGTLLVLLLLGGAARMWQARTVGPGVRLPGGTFRMGSTDVEIEAAQKMCLHTAGPADCPAANLERERPPRQVSVSSFLLDRDEVTNEEYAAWLNRAPGIRLWFERMVWQEGTPRVLLADVAPALGHGGLTAEGGRYKARPGYERRPMLQVTWDGALGYCRARGGRLPTEAEWEYAARGGSTAGFPWPWGDRPPSCEEAVYGREKGRGCEALGYGPAAVGSGTRDVTPAGIRGLGGNASEWVMDRFVAPYPACAAPCLDPVVTDGTGEDLRVARGGDWALPAVYTRAASRSRFRRDDASGSVGFRCAMPVRR